MLQKQAFSLAEAGKAEALAHWLQSYPRLATAVNANGTTLLASAAKRGHVEVVNLMLARPESARLINQANRRGETPLQRAVEAGRTAVVEALLQHAEINPNRVDQRGQTLLHIAVGSQHVGIASALAVHRRTNVNQAGPDGNTALHRAAYKGRPDMLRTLLGDDRVDPNLPNAKGHTPLAIAIGKLHIDCVRELAGHPGVDVNLPDRSGRPPIWQALNQMLEHLEGGSVARYRMRSGKESACLMELARSPQINLDARSPGGHTPLTRLASARPHWNGVAGLDATLRDVQYKRCVLDGVRAILEGSKDSNSFHPNARNIDGQAAIQIALRNQNDAMVTALLRDPRTDPGAVVTRLFREPNRLFRLVNPGRPVPKTDFSRQVFLMEQLDRAIRFRNPDGTANPWISQALCEYAARFAISDEAQRRASSPAAECLPDATSYATLALEFAIAFRQTPMMKVAAQALIHHAPAGQSYVNVDGVDVSRSEIEAWAAGKIPEGILNARIEQRVRDGRVNVHADGLLTCGQQLLAEMKRRTPEGQRRSVDQSVADVRGLIDQATMQARQALKAELMTGETEREAVEEKGSGTVDARASTATDGQTARLKRRIADLGDAEDGIRHLLKMGPTAVDPDYAFGANLALADTWSYAQSRQDPELRSNLTAALLRRLADVGKDRPCNTGCIQRVAFTSEGVDPSLNNAEPDRAAMYNEIVSIAKQVNSRYEALYGNINASDHSAPGTSSEPPRTRHDPRTVAQYTNGAEIDEDVVNDVKRDMVRAAVLADLVERRGWTRAKVEEVMAPVLENVEYLDALNGSAPGSQSAQTRT